MRAVTGPFFPSENGKIRANKKVVLDDGLIFVCVKIYKQSIANFMKDVTLFMKGL